MQSFASMKEVASILGQPLRTVQRWLHNLKFGIGLKRKPGSGRPSQFQTNDRRRMAGFVAKHKRWSTTRIGSPASAGKSGVA